MPHSAPWMALQYAAEGRYLAACSWWTCREEMAPDEGWVTTSPDD